MKKKVLLSMFSFLMLFALMLGVNASLNIPANTKAKAPTVIPAENAELYGAVTQEFDFSKISFTATSGEDIKGKSNMEKIILSANVDFTKTGIEVLGSNWFSAYCLDGTLKYPIFGYLNRTFAEDISSDYQKQLDAYVLAALFNDKSLYSVFETAKGKATTPTVTYTVKDGTEAQTVISNLDAGQNVTVSITEVKYDDPGASLTITGQQLTNNNGDAYDLTFTKADALLDKYTTTKMGDKSYDHALWILEHTYPTLELKESLTYAGVDYDRLKTELDALEGSSVDDDKIENYVYSTIQYAIWKVYDGIDIGGRKLGDELKGSDELNKLYQFLIKDRTIYNGYGNLQFTNELTLNRPEEGKEIYKENDKTYVYGPYTANYDVLEGGNIDVSVGNADSTGIKIVNADGTEINSVAPNQEFYVECSKDQKIANVSIKLGLRDASMFDPITNRGRIYYAHYANVQNVISGGKIVHQNLEKSFDLVFNPKTGVEDVSLVLLVALVAFSIAYLLLSYKNKSVEFN